MGQALVLAFLNKGISVGIKSVEVYVGVGIYQLHGAKMG